MAVVERDGRLVGRDAVLGIAGAALDDAIDGRGQLLLISGEPGIGKSALLAEIARTARARGVQVSRGLCWEGAGAPPYWPWTQVLRGIELSPVDLGEADRLTAGQAATGIDSGSEAADARFRLFDDVARVLARLARSSALLVILDDLQWADDSSLHLLEFAARQLAEHPVLIIGAYRDTQTNATLHRLPGQVLPLTGLTPDEVATLMTAVGGSRPSPQQAEAVWRRCGGNPLFVRELTRLVLVRGGWEHADGHSRAMPDSVRDTLTARLERLSQPCAELLVVAAVAGLDVPIDVLARVLDVTEDAVADLLDEAMRARIVVSNGRARIAHDLFRDAILASVSSARRAELHGAIGQVLLELAGGSSVRDLSAVGGAARLAAHFVAAGPTAADLAVEYSVRAAEEASMRLGHADAVEHYETALGLLPANAAATVDVLLGLAAARDRAGDQLAARAAFRRVAELARIGGDPRALARAALGLHGLGSRAGADDRDCAELLAEAADALRAAIARESAGAERALLALRSEVLAALARMHRHTRREALDPIARTVAREAVELAEAAGDPAALALALLAEHDVAWEHGSAHERLQILAAMADAAARAHDRDLVAEAKLLRAAALIELGEPAGRAELEQYTRLAADLGHARGRWGALSRRATLAELAGRVDEAIELSDAAVELGCKIGIPDALGCFSTLRGSLGSLGAAVPMVDDVLAETDPLWPIFPLLRAWIFISNGELEPAAACIRGFAIQDIVGKYDLELMAVAATVCAAVGSPSQREWIYAQLQSYAGLHVVIGGCAAYHGAVDHFLGLLAASLGRTEEAARYFVAAIALHDRLGTPAWAQLSRRQLDQIERARPANVFRSAGGAWQLVFDGHEVHLPDAKGMRDIAALLSTPGREIPVWSLLGSPAPPGGADPVLDEHARSLYAARLAELDAEIAGADAANDAIRSGRACAERDALVHELAAAAGLGRRRRRLGDETERARKTVTARIRDALVRIERVHPRLALHLRASINTGTTCIYAPAEDSRWLV